MKVGVIGLGLIGGSIAKALKNKLDIQVIGIDKNEDYIKSALTDNVITSGSSDYSALNMCDIIFLCLPVKDNINCLKEVIKYVKPGTIITDVSSTKNEIANYAKSIIDKDIIFIGGHPMAGSEKSGYYESKPHLFENAYYILTPIKGTTGDAVNTITELIKGIGGIPITLKPEEHDLIVAAISHMPHIMASTIVNITKSLDKDNYMQKLAAGGFKDITRIASSDPIMWENICYSNKENINRLLDMYINKLNEIKQVIGNQEQNGIIMEFESSKKYRDSIPDINRGDIESMFNLYVDIEDKPGVIGIIATILGDNNINIKNIGISNSREHQIGCLVISFNNKEHLDNAYTILSRHGYGVEV